MAEQGQVATRLLEVGGEEKKETRVMELPVPGVVKRAARRRAAAQASGKDGGDVSGPPPALVDTVFAELHRGYTRLHRLDRWALWLVGLSFIGAFLPWKRVQVQGLVSGVETYGVLSAVMAALAIAAIVWRAQRRRGAAMLMLLQLFALSVTVAVPVVSVAAFGRQISWHMGAAVVVVAGVLALLVSFGRLFRLHA